jgi:HSP20 family protein
MLPVLRNTSAWAPTHSYPINRLDTWFDQFFGDDGGSPNRAWAGMPVALWDDEDHFYIEAELPGVMDREVDVTVHNGMLFIRGERRPEEGRRYLYNSRSFGRFERVITLPEAVNADDVHATLKDGILSVTLPKSPEAKPKKISLQAG